MSRVIHRRRLARGAVRITCRVEGHIAVGVDDGFQNERVCVPRLYHLQDFIVVNWGSPNEGAVLLNYVDARVEVALEGDMIRIGVARPELTFGIYKEKLYIGSTINNYDDLYNYYFKSIHIHLNVLLAWETTRIEVYIYVCFMHYIPESEPLAWRLPPFSMPT